MFGRRDSRSLVKEIGGCKETREKEPRAPDVRTPRNLGDLRRCKA